MIYFAARDASARAGGSAPRTPRDIFRQKMRGSEIIRDLSVRARNLEDRKVQDRQFVRQRR